MANFTPQQIEEFLQEFFDVVGTRQYIGARYVPLFGRKGESSIEWDNSAPYEPLTIVMHSGDSYTSRSYVPTGIDISNTDYWVMTGPYNAQIAAYIEQFNALSQQMAQYRTDINDDFDDFKHEQQSNYDTFVSTVDRMSCMRPNCVLIGDSWTSDTSATIVNGVNWRQYLKGWTFHNYAVGGAGFLVGTTYEMQIDNAIADTTYNHDTITDVIIMGGINDFRHSSSGSDYTSALRAVIGKAATEFRFARIHLWFASTDKPNLTSNSHWNNSYPLWSQLCRWVNLSYSNGSLSNVNYGQLDTQIFTHLFPMSAFIETDADNWQRHLSTEGHRVLSRIVASLIYTGNLPVGIIESNKDIPVYLDSDPTVRIGRIQNLKGIRSAHGYQYKAVYKADATYTGKTIGYVDMSTEALNIEYFNVNPSTGLFNFCPLDLFPAPADPTAGIANNDSFVKMGEISAPTLVGSSFSVQSSIPFAMDMCFLPFYADNPLRIRMTTYDQNQNDSYTFVKTVDYRYEHTNDLSVPNDNEGIGFITFV